MIQSINKKTLTGHSWWLACEIVRRHKALELVTCISTAGLDETLGIVDRKTGRLLAFLSDEVPNRAVVSGSPDATWAFGWNQILDFRPREAVVAIEGKLGLYSPNHALETTEEILTYRLISKIIADHIWSAEVWSATSCGIFDGESQDLIPTDFLDEFPSALDKYESSHGRNANGPVAKGYWVLSRNGVEMLVLDEDAFLHFPDNRAPMPLMKRFNLFDRKIGVLTASVLSQLPKAGA